MTQPEIKNPDDGNKDSQVTAETLVKLQEQVDNLNKGQATYRDEIKTYKTTIDSLTTELDTLKTSITESKDTDIDEDIVLNPEDEKKLETWAKKQGFVSKDELVAERQRMNLDTIKGFETQAVSEFIEKHPEYDTDENWQKVLAEFQLYRQPTSIDGYRKLLNRIHEDFSKGTNRAREEGRSQVKVEELQKGRLSLGGGSQGSGQEDQEIEKLQKRYPNLSRDQIQERLSEIGSLYSKK